MKSNSIRQTATQHFDAMLDMAGRLQKDVTQAQREKELGLRIVDEGLAMDPGAVLQLSELLPSDIDRQEGFHLAMHVMPYLCGALCLFKCEFAHASLGEVPSAQVSLLLDGAESVMHEGVELTQTNVVMQYRRRAG